MGFDILAWIAAIGALAGGGAAVAQASKDIPEAPKPMEAPRPPTIDDAARRRDEEDRGRRRRGRAATVLTGPQGAGLPTTATKTLLGA